MIHHGDLSPHQAVRSLARHPARLIQHAFEHSHIGLVITAADGHIVLLNAAFSRLTGSNSIEAVGQPIEHFFISLRSPYPLSRETQHDTQEPLSWQQDVLCRQGNNESIPVLMTVDTMPDKRHEAHHFLYAFAPLSAAENDPAYDRHWIHLDPMTGLANWLLLRDRLNHAVAQVERTDTTLALLYLNLDRFKMVNATVGHIEGDRILVEIAKRLQREVRSKDTLARLGSDQFVVLLEKDGSAEAAQTVAERLHEALEPAFISGNRTLLLTASIGVALCPNDAGDAETLISTARSAMFKARKKGPGHLAFVDHSLTTRLKERHRLEAMLSEAVHMPERHFSLRYQPEFDRHTLTVTGLEATLAWQQPKRWQHAPAHYLDDITQLGLGVRLDRWLIQAAVANFLQWRKEDAATGKLPVSLTLCEAHLAQETFDQRPLDRFLSHQTNTPFDWLTLKIPARGVNRDLNGALHMLKRLEQLGIHLAVDELNGSPMDLAWLARLPFHKATLCARLACERAGEPRLLEATNRLLQTLEIEPVLVGIDNDAIAAQVKSVSTRLVQGDLYGAAMSAEALTQWLDA